MKTALYTGSFDPITKGHLDIIERAAQMFGSLVIGIGDNPAKKYTFTQEERIAMVTHNVAHLDNVTVIVIANGRLTADVAYELNAVILKGVRMNAQDFDYEWLMADINRAHVHGLQTIIMPASPEYNSISSSATKEVCKLHGNTHDFVPINVKQALEQKLVGQRRLIVTGTIGAGKSTLTDALRYRTNCKDISTPIHEAHDIDLDVIAREILFDRPEPAYVKLREDIKTNLHLSTWNRKDLGALIFKDSGARAYLDEAVRQPLMTRLRVALQGKKGLIIFNGALLVEAHWLYLANNNVLLVDVDPDEQTKRLKARGYTATQIRRRVSAQYTTNQKQALIIDQIRRDKHGKYKILNTTDVDLDHATDHADAFIQTSI